MNFVKHLFFIPFLLLFMSSVFANHSNKLHFSNADIASPPVKKSLLNKKANCFTFCNPYKLNTMCRMIQTGNYQGVRSLINKGEDINEKSVRLTPLMYAARHNRVDIARLLIANGADLHKKSSQGYTALKWAKLSNASEVYEVLLVAIKGQSRKR